MQLDAKGRVWIAGGRTGQIFIVDPKKRRVEKTLSTGTGGLHNDIALDFSGTPIEYIKGANLNGIAATADGTG